MQDLADAGHRTRATYSDGIMVPSKKDGDAEPVPCAGNDGTLIVVSPPPLSSVRRLTSDSLQVEDLFYNTPTRLKSLRSPSEEYSRILSVLLHYSIHNSGISFVCKKAGATTADVNTAIGASVLDNIGMGFGEALRRELVEVKCEDEAMGVKASGWFSGGNFGGKKGVFLFFINRECLPEVVRTPTDERTDRLVDCTPLKRAFEAFYGTLLSKGVHPFVYLSLDINPARVDVNVHPTKLEVGLEDEEEIVNLICEALGKKLEAASDSRTFKVQVGVPI
jgi:DNA mismatch repair protein MLH1